MKQNLFETGFNTVVRDYYNWKANVEHIEVFGKQIKIDQETASWKGPGKAGGFSHFKGPYRTVQDPIGYSYRGQYFYL